MMALYLEIFLYKHPDAKYLFTEDLDKKAPNKLKFTYSRDLRTKVWRTSSFMALAPEAGQVDSNGWPLDIGTHSGRKCPAEYSANCGASPNETEIRGRWKGVKGGRVIFRYIKAQQAYEDARVAALLCRGGPVRYKLKDGISIPDEWLFANVVAHIRKRYPNDTRLCSVLALPLLFICLGSDENVHVPGVLRNHVRSKYSLLGLDEEQPVEKIALHVYRGPNGTFGIDDCVGVGTGAGGASEGALQGGGPMTAEMAQTILVRMHALETSQMQAQANLSATISEFRNYSASQFRLLNNNIRAYGGTIQGSLVRLRPSNQQTRVASTHEASSENLAPLVEAAPARLSNNPRSLMCLWNEYKYGLNGRKPAEQFTVAERNTTLSKQTYYRRNIVWQAIARQVRAGLTAEVAIGRIRSAYGYDASPTKTIVAMVRDKRRYADGIHPNLV